jgi:hypothetical protein
MAIGSSLDAAEDGLDDEDDAVGDPAQPVLLLLLADDVATVRLVWVE